MYLTVMALPAMHTDARAATVLAARLLAIVGTEGRALAFFARRALALVLANGGSSTLLHQHKRA